MKHLAEWVSLMKCWGSILRCQGGLSQHVEVDSVKVEKWSLGVNVVSRTN